MLGYAGARAYRFQVCKENSGWNATNRFASCRSGNLEATRPQLDQNSGGYIEVASTLDPVRIKSTAADVNRCPLLRCYQHGNRGFCYVELSRSTRTVFPVTLREEDWWIVSY